MSKPKLFIGSSQKNLRVAQLIAHGLEKEQQLKDVIEVTIWSEGVFGLNKGYLEELLASLEEFDFAIFVLASDDVTTSNGEERPAPRDNVLFESGLFMGVLGRHHVFLAVDEAAKLKIPSDLAGVTLATFDGNRLDDGGVRDACFTIAEAIQVKRFTDLVGPWRSLFPETTELDGQAIVEETEIKPCRGGVSIITQGNTEFASAAVGRMPMDRQLIGTWKGSDQQTGTRGVFLLTINPNHTLMYGYFTSPDANGGVTYASWLLAKKDGADEAKIRKRLQMAHELLTKTRVDIALPAAKDGT